MSYFFRLYFVCVCIALLISSYTISAQDNETLLSVWCIGKLRSRFLLITTDLLVYDLPVDSFNGGLCIKSPTAVTPTPLAHKWPTLVGSKHYQSSINYTTNCFTVFDRVSEYVVASGQHNGAIAGFVYNINQNRVKDVFNFANDTWMISSDEELESQYAISAQDQSLQIEKYTFSANNSVWDSERIDVQSHYAICQDGDDETQVRLQSSSSCDSPNLTVTHGLLESGKLYLFDNTNNKVIVFPEEIYDTTDGVFSLKTVSFDDFFGCYSKSLLKHILIDSIVVIIIIAVAIWLIILFCTKASSRSDKGKPAVLSSSPNSVKRRLRLGKYRSSSLKNSSLDIKRSGQNGQSSRCTNDTKKSSNPQARQSTSRTATRTKQGSKQVVSGKVVSLKCTAQSKSKSIGGNFYANLMKMNRVKSISQYQD